MSRKADLKEVDRAGASAGLTPSQRREFGRFLERCKREGDRGTKNNRGDYTYDELLQKAKEFKEGLK